MKFYAIYTCTMCGAKFRITDKPAEFDREHGPELVAKIIGNQTMLGNPYLYQAPMHLPHNCSNGCIRIAQLSGFQPAEFERKDNSNGKKKSVFQLNRRSDQK